MNLIGFIIIAQAIIIPDVYSLRFCVIPLSAASNLPHDAVDHAWPVVQPKTVDVASAYPTLLYGAFDPTIVDLIGADARADAYHTIPFYALNLLFLPTAFFISPCVQFPSDGLEFLFEVLVPCVTTRVPWNVTRQFYELLHVIYAPLLPPACAILLLYDAHALVCDATQLLFVQPLTQYEDAQDAQALVCVYAPNLNLYADLAKSDHLEDHELTDRERYHDHTYFEHDKEESASGYKFDADCECHRCHASFQCDKKVSAGGYKSNLGVIIHGYELQWAF